MQHHLPHFESLRELAAGLIGFLGFVWMPMLIVIVLAHIIVRCTSA